MADEDSLTPSDGQRKRRVRFTVDQDGMRKPIVIRGSFDGAPPIWFSGIFLMTGLLVLTFTLTSTFHGQRTAGEYLVGLAFSLLFGGSFTAIGGWMLLLRHQMKTALRARDLQRQLGITHEDFQNLIEDKRIVPRYEVNGEPLYEPSDFEGGILLRAASSDGQSELLRPAGAAVTESENLLRADDSAGAQPAIEPRTGEQEVEIARVS